MQVEPAAAITIIAPAVLTPVFAHWLWRNAARFGLVAQQNNRSSHIGTKASGGGITVLSAVWIGLLPTLSALPTNSVLAWIVVSLFALVGLMDDARGLRASIRLIAQFIAATLLVLLLGPSTLGSGGLPWVLAATTIVGTVYFINLFNFMDGIDGLASSQAAFVLLGAALLSALAINDLSPVHLAGIGMAMGALGFLLMNWHPARIFVGDVGAYAYSSVIILVGLWGWANGAVDPIAYIVLNSLFISDASVTLSRRALSGKKIWQAHRSHAYQRLSRRWGHARAVLLFIFLNVMVILPLAVLTQLHILTWSVALLLSFGPSIVLFASLGAGREDEAVR